MASILNLCDDADRIRAREKLTTLARHNPQAKGCCCLRDQLTINFENMFLRPWPKFYAPYVRDWSTPDLTQAKKCCGKGHGYNEAELEDMMNEDNNDDQ